MDRQRLADFVRDVPDFPKKGIVFKDITPLLADAEAFRETIAMMAEPYRNEVPDMIVGIDARGFLLAAPLAHELGCGLAIVRKKGKLPYDRKSRSYDLEYGSETLEIHTDAVRPNQNVVIVDDVLATGGTMEATIGLTQALGGTVQGVSVLIDLAFIGGRERLKEHGKSMEALLQITEPNGETLPAPAHHLEKALS